jgi:hypothetical protein
MMAMVVEMMMPMPTMMRNPMMTMEMLVVVEVW